MKLVRIERRRYNIPKEVKDRMQYKDSVYLQQYRPSQAKVDYKIIEEKKAFV